MTEAPSRYERQDLEKYYTPAWVTQALLSIEALRGVTVDPAAGDWHVVHALIGGGVEAMGFDISPASPLGATADFLSWNGDVVTRYPKPLANIVTNPPFGKGGRLAVAFIDHALKLTKPRGGKVAMLLRVDFDSASGRRHLFSDHPAFARKIVLTTRIRWANLPQSAAGPTQNHAWYVWDWSKDPNALPVVNYAGQKREAA